MNTDFMYIGRRKVYTSGNSKHLSIPKHILREVEEDLTYKLIEEVELYYDKENKEMIIKFIQKSK